MDEKGFNGRVRNGIGWDTFAGTPDHLITSGIRGRLQEIIYTIKNQANRTISIG